MQTTHDSYEHKVPRFLSVFKVNSIGRRETDEVGSTPCCEFSLIVAEMNRPGGQVGKAKYKVLHKSRAQLSRHFVENNAHKVHKTWGEKNWPDNKVAQQKSWNKGQTSADRNTRLLSCLQYLVP
jgi:hypothetical protein